MDSTKILGFVLLTIGLLIIIFTLFSSYNIFTGKTAIPVIFKIEEKTEENVTPKGELTPTEIQKEVETMIQSQLSQLIPMESIMKIFNLISWSILAFILIFGGSKISELGINLIKK